MVTLIGKGVCSAVAIGTIHFYRRSRREIEKKNIENPSVELAKFKRSIKSAEKEIDELYDTAYEKVGENEAEIFKIHRMILEDKDYTEAVEGIIADERVNCEYAIFETCEKFQKIFLSMDDEYMRGRAADIKDVSERLLNILGGGSHSEISGDRVILAADDLAPSETVRLDKDKIIAFVTEKGSENSHTAILARNMNIPAIVNMGTLDRKLDGKTAVVDGHSGVMYAEPSEEIIDEYRQRIVREKEYEQRLKNYIGKESVTQSGRKIKLYANIGSPDDIDAVIRSDAEGIGLFRSEFLFLGRNAPPDEEEQLKAYSSVLKSMGGKKVIVRTMDIGADKMVEYLGLAKEENPAMGLRAIRICLENKTIFKTQLRALYRASVYGNLSIMFPMITSLDEINEIKSVITAVKAGLTKDKLSFRDDVQFGIMIETPAAAVISDILAPEVDFFSIGTNDLISYTLAADRQNTHLERYAKSDHEAVMRLIERSIENGHKNGIWVGICGEMGADLSLTDRLINLGIDELSVTPSAVLKVREKIIEHK